MCSKCGEHKSLSDFARHPKNGTRPECKLCQRAAARIYQARREDPRRWDRENAERKRATTRAWKAQNKQRLSELQLAREARKRAQFVERVDPVRLLEAHGGRCGICGESIDGTFHVDHVVPLSRGGEHSYANTQPAHPVCNYRKHNALPGEYPSPGRRGRLKPKEVSA